MGRRSGRQRLLTTAIAAGLAGYGAYRLYRSEAFRRVCRASRAAWDLLDALSGAAALSARAARELSCFLETDTEEVPQCVRQLFKLLCSQEAQWAVSSFTRAAVDGMADSLGPRGRGDPSRPLGHTVLEALLSERGSDLVSLAVGVAARNSVRTMWECLQESGAHGPERSGRPAASSYPFLDELLRLMCTDDGQRLVARVVSAFASGLASSYMDRMDGVNAFEHLFEAMSRPAHLEALLLITGVSSREAMSAVVRGSFSTQGNFPARNADWDSNNNSTLSEDDSALETPAVAFPMHGSTASQEDTERYSPSGYRTRGWVGGCNRAAPDPSTSALVVVNEDVPHPLVSAVVAASRVPEARELLASIAGSAAREGARGVVHSIPEVLYRALRRSRVQRGSCSRDAGTGFSIQGTRVAMTVMMSVILYASTSVPLL